MPEEIYPVELTAPDIEPYRKGNIGIDFVTSFDSGKPGPRLTAVEGSDKIDPNITFPIGLYIWCSEFYGVNFFGHQNNPNY